MRRIACVLMWSALVAGGLATAPAQALSPLFDPATMLRPSEVAPGTRAVAKSVFAGTEVTAFSVELLSVVKGMNLGGDLVLCRVLDGPIIERQAGIIRGMSGSPVYVDGRLLGAISSTYAFSREPLGMVTPIEDMLETFVDQATEPVAAGRAEGLLDRPVLIGGRLVRRVIVARNRPTTPSDIGSDAALFVPVEAPVFLGGFSASVFAGLQRFFTNHNLVPMAGPGSGDSSQVVDLQPGSAMSVPLMSGDFTAAVSGTLTWRNGDRVLGFGHPFMSAGAMDVPLAGAYVHDIVPAMDIGSKIMSPLATVGSALWDNNWAVGGLIGAKPPVIPFDIEVTNRTNGRKRTFHVDVADDPTFTPMMLTSAAASALEAVTYGTAKSSVRVTTTVESDHGPLSRSNVFYAPRGGATIALTDLTTAVMLLTSSVFEEANITSGRLVCEVLHDRGDATIESVELDDYVVRPGQTLRIGVVLRVGATQRERKVIELLVPEDSPTGPLVLAVCAGGMLPAAEGGMNILRPTPRDLRGVMNLYLDLPPNNEIVATLVSESETVITAGVEMPDLPTMIAAVIGTAGTTDLQAGKGYVRATLDTEWAVDGLIQHPIIVVRPEDEAEDVVRSPRPEQAALAAPPLGGSAPLVYGLAGPCGEYIEVSAPVRALLEAVDPYDILGSRTERALSALHRAAPLPAFHVRARTPVQDGSVRKVEEEPIEDEPPPGTAPEAEPGPGPAPSAPEGGDGSDSEGTSSKEGSGESEELEPTAVRGPKAWTQSSRDDFVTGQPSGISVNELGTLTLVAPLDTVPVELGDLYVWDCALGKDGSAFLGTGRDGGVYRVASDGSSSLFFTVDDLMVFSLLVGDDGTVYAGTGPKGLIYRIGADGTGEVLCETGERYVWDLVFDPQGTLLAGTGSRGRVLAIRDGKPETIYDSAEAHINVLQVGPDGRLFGGTGEAGTVIEIGNGTARTLCESPKGAVHCLAVGASGDLFFGAATMDSAGIYRLTPDGGLRTLEETEDGSLLAMASDGNGRAFAGTGAFARLFVADSEDHVALIGEAEEIESQFIDIAYDPASQILYACASNPPRLYRARLSDGQEGTLESVVFDAESPVRWTGLEWRGELPEGTEVAVQARTGNTAAPDETWSGWSRSYSQPGRAALDVPDGRYAQYRATLRSVTGGTTPVLDAVRVYYLARNARPVVTVEDELASAVSKDFELSWTAEDANEDTLTYSLHVSSDAGKTWDEVATGLTETKTKWDTTKHTDGAYLVRVSASDEKQNPTDPQVGEIVMGPTVVDNTSPEVTLLRQSLTVTGKDSVHVSASASDTGSGVRSVQYRVDTGDWRAVPAADGLFDSGYERFEFDATKLSGGEHTIEVIAFDEAGNKASASKPVTVEGGGEPAAEETKTPSEGSAPKEVAAEAPTTGAPAELTADQVIDRVTAQYADLKDFKVDVEMTVTAPPGLDTHGSPRDATMAMTFYFKRPNKMAVEMGGKVVPVPEEQKDMMWTPESPLAEGAKAKLLGTTEENGITVYEIEITPGKRAADRVRRSVLYIESANWTIPRAIAYLKTPSGGAAEAPVALTYEKVEGFFVPVRLEQEMPKAMFGSAAKGDGKAVVVMKNWRINKGIPDSTFK